MAYSFTPTGLDDFLDDLYLLSDSSILAEATLVAADFEDWLETNFTLSTDQQTYLTSAPLQMKKTWGWLFAAAMNTRGKIAMSSPDNPTRRTKEIERTVSGVITYNDSDQKQEGSLDVDIEWNLL